MDREENTAFPTFSSHWLIARGTAGLEAAKSDPSKVVDRMEATFSIQM
jgi:hypothetical protein